jgi:phosphopantothenoylcysteine decarboxylase/phosphopantothenate--cysteine ligase
VDVARRLVKEGAIVRVVMTEAACRFITPYTLETVTANPVGSDLFKDPFSHLNLAGDAHVLLIAPATANTINKLNCGIADNLLSNIFLAYSGKTIIAPAMNPRMYKNPIVAKSIRNLLKSGIEFVGPVSGSLACGDEGVGRMADITDIVESVISAMTQKDLAGHKIIVTAGPTREYIDPVRFISNRSSGKMGYEIARAAVRRGADVTLVSGPSALKPPGRVTHLPVESATEMEDMVLKNLRGSNALIMAAAVSDFSPSSSKSSKIKKSDITSIRLKRTPDILMKAGGYKGRLILIGFAAETGKNLENARKKLKEKNLDIIVLNDIAQKGSGFDVDTNIVTIINKEGEAVDYPKMKKIDVANIILDSMSTLLPR